MQRLPVYLRIDFRLSQSCFSRSVYIFSDWFYFLVFGISDTILEKKSSHCLSKNSTLDFFAITKVQPNFE